MRAHILFRQHPTARLEPFCAGFRALGYDIVRGNLEPRRGDVLVIWNRRPGHGHEIACQWESAGHPVIVAENGYVGALPTECRLYALALGSHNGAGRWHVGDEDRWSRFGLPAAPWTRDGDHVLVLPQRGIGQPGVAMPRDWTASIEQRLARMSKRPVRVRRHPGNLKAHTAPLKPDLDGAWCVVTWGSGAALKAILAGVPVFYGLGRWIGAPAALPLAGANIERPWRGDRSEMLHALGWAQWTVEEIARGEPFRHLLRGSTQG